MSHKVGGMLVAVTLKQCYLLYAAGIEECQSHMAQDTELADMICSITQSVRYHQLSISTCPFTDKDIRPMEVIVRHATLETHSSVASSQIDASQIAAEWPHLPVLQSCARG